jgi:hypothetical protein
MKPWIVALLLWLVPLSAGADEPTGRIEAGQVLRGRFVQERQLQGFNAPLRSEGHFVLVPGQGIIWQAEIPFAVTTVITPAGLAQESGGARTLSLPATRLPFLPKLYDMLNAALAGQWQGLETEFSVQRTGTPSAWRILLTPRSGADPTRMPFSSITAEGGGFVERVAIAKPGGDVDRLTFLDQGLSSGPPAPDEAAALAGAGR